MYKKYNKALAIIDHMHKVSIKEISRRWNKKEKTVSLFFTSKKLIRCRNYTEMEEYILANFSAKLCSEIITDKSLNSLKIKRCRLIK